MTAEPEPLASGSVRVLAYEVNGEPADVVRLTEEPEPSISADEVLVALEAVPLHIADLKAIRGELAFVPKGPGSPGFEGVGRIVACGGAVAEWEAGDRVILPLRYGTCRQRLAVPADDLWRAPEDVPAEQLALTRINLTTAYMLLHAYIELRPDDWIIQNAANSNVASYVAALAQDLGVGVINLVRRPELVSGLQARGLRNVTLDDRASISRMCAELAVTPRLALDAIGGDATARLASAVADGGKVLAYGFSSEQPYQIHYQDAIFREVSLEVMTINQAVQKMGPEGLRDMSGALQTFIATRPLNAEIAGVYRFDQAADALRHAAQTGSARAGKVILVP